MRTNLKNTVLMDRTTLIRSFGLWVTLAFFSAVASGQLVTATLPGAAHPIVNPVTNKIYAIDSGGLMVIDGATNSTTTVTVGANPFPIAVNPATNKIYVVNEGDNTVTIVDGATNGTTSVSAGTRPFAVAVDPVLNQIYVATLQGQLIVINGTTNTTTTVPIAPQAADVAVNLVTHDVYIPSCDGDGHGTDSHVSIVDGQTLVVVNTITVAGLDCNDQVAVNSVTNQAYVAQQDSLSPAIIVISGTSSLFVTIPLTTGVSGGEFPFRVQVNPATNKIYVGGSQGDLTIIDGALGTASVVKVGLTADSLAINNVTNQIYVQDFVGNTLVIMDGATLALTTLPVGGSPRDVAVNPVTGKVYVAGDTSTEVIDGATNKPVSVPAGLSPAGVGVNAVTGKAYVADSNGASVTVIDGATNQTLEVPAGTTPVAVGVNAATNQIYVANKDSNNVTVIDGATNNTTTIAAGTTPVAVAVNSSTNFIYVANKGSNSVTVIDGTTNTPTTIAVGTTPVALAVNQPANEIYVANQDSDNVTVIDGNTNATTTIAAGRSPFAVAVNPLTNKTYVANGDNNVVVIDGVTKATSAVPVGLGPVSVAVDTVTNKIYTANQAGGNVTEIDGPSNLTTTIPAGLFPLAVAVDQTTNKIYAVNGDNNAIVIDGATNTTSIVAVGSGPVALAVDPVANKVYVANAFTGNVTVIAEQQVQPVPLITTIAPASFTGIVSLVSNPVFNFTPQSNYFPNNPAPQNVFFQIDNWQGAWTAAGASAGNFSGQSPSLVLGDHVLYAYAGDGSEATSLAAFETVIGQIAAYPFTVASTTALQPQIIVNVPIGTLTVTRGGSAVYTLEVSAQGTLPTAVTFSCGPLPAETTCTFNPTSVDATSTPTPVTLTISTQAPQVSMNAPASFPKSGSLLAVGLLFPALVLCTPSLRRRRPAGGRVKRCATIGVMTALVLFLAACGGSNAKTPTGGTPTGTFNITITSSAGGIQTTTPITLTVEP